MDFDFTCGTCSCCHDVYDITTICNVCLSCIFKCDKHECRKTSFENILISDQFKVSLPMIEELD